MDYTVALEEINNYEHVLEGISVSEIFNKFVGWLKAIWSRVKQWFYKLIKSDKLDRLVHIKMYDQFKVGFRETKKVFDKTFLKYDLVSDYPVMVSELEELNELWDEMTRQMNFILMNNADDHWWRTAPMNDAKNMFNTLDKTFKETIKNIESFDVAEIDADLTQPIGKIINLLSTISTKFMKCYDSMLYSNRYIDTGFDGSATGLHF